MYGEAIEKLCVLLREPALDYAAGYHEVVPVVEAAFAEYVGDGGGETGKILGEHGVVVLDNIVQHAAVATEKQVIEDRAVCESVAGEAIPYRYVGLVCSLGFGVTHRNVAQIRGKVAQ